MLILLYGPDTYRLKEKLRNMKEKFVREVDGSGMNIVTLDGEKTDMEKFSDAAAYAGFLVKKRMIVVENLIGRNRSQKVQDEILDYLKKMPASARSGQSGDSENIIVFAEETDGDERKKGAKKNALLDFLKKEKYALEFPLLSGHQLARWITAETEKRGGKIKDSAARMLADFAGNDLWRASNEIDKLIALNHGKGSDITEGDVSLLSKAKGDENIFNLVDAIGNKNKKLALKLISDQIESGISWGYILAMLVRQFRIILQAREMTESGRGGDLASKLGIHPFVAQKARAQAGNYGLEELKNIYRQLLEIDVRLKSMAIKPEVLFDLLVIGS